MKRRSIIFWIQALDLSSISRAVALAVFFLLLVGCWSSSPQPQGSADGTNDFTGRLIQVSTDSPRVIPLSPALAEMCAELLDDRLDQMVARTRYADYPPGIRRLPVIGTYVRFNLEEVVSKKADVVLATRDGNSPDQVHRLRELGQNVVVVDTGSIQDIRRTYQVLGRALNQEDSARRALARFDRGFSALEARAAKLKSIRPKVMVQLERQPTVVVGGKGFLSEALRRIGAQSAFDDLEQRYPRVSAETVLSRNPDIIAHLSLGFRRAKATGWEETSGLKAGRNSRLWVLTIDGLVRPSLRLIEALGHFQQRLLVSYQLSDTLPSK
jgi:ABC-type Fe3+-hydroxamate transport system substrate-binding protein